jgi:tetratricopeptide (TPR) repeat protein
MTKAYQINLWHWLLPAAFAMAFAIGGPASLAMAAGGSGGGGSGAGGSAGAGTGNGGDAPPGKIQSGGEDLTTCQKGQIWDRKGHKCQIKKSGALPDDQMVEYAYALAKADRFDEALETLDLLQDPNTPRALNYRGYATRKLGRTDEGIGYYLKSVALDPQYAQVREYLGEAYAIEGKFDLAKQQLDTIAKICGSTECEEYEDLAAAIRSGQGA